MLFLAQQMQLFETATGCGRMSLNSPLLSEMLMRSLPLKSLLYTWWGHATPHLHRTSHAIPRQTCACSNTQSAAVFRQLIPLLRYRTVTEREATSNGHLENSVLHLQLPPSNYFRFVAGHLKTKQLPWVQNIHSSIALCVHFLKIF